MAFKRRVDKLRRLSEGFTMIYDIFHMTEFANKLEIVANHCDDRELLLIIDPCYEYDESQIDNAREAIKTHIGNEKTEYFKWLGFEVLDTPNELDDDEYLLGFSVKLEDLE